MAERIGCLLVHGINGSLDDMSEIAEELEQLGYITRNMLLPGHGTCLEDMAASRWNDWEKAVESEFLLLRQSCSYVFLIGHSLGGALCLKIGVRYQPDGIISMCAPLTLYPGLDILVMLGKRFISGVPTISLDIRDKEQRRQIRSKTYPQTMLAPVGSMLDALSLLRKELPDLQSPLLVITARHDHVVPFHDGKLVYQLAGSVDKNLVILPRSYHVVMKDIEKHIVMDHIAGFLSEHRKAA